MSDYPSLMMAGTPEMLMIPKAVLRVEKQYYTVDTLVRVAWKGYYHWLLVEIDEPGPINPESLEREEKINLPMIRLTERDLLRVDFMDRFRKKIRGIVSKLKPGQYPPPQLVDPAYRQRDRAHGPSPTLSVRYSAN